MRHLEMLSTAATHQLYGNLRHLADLDTDVDDDERDRGAVSLEQVLWFVAAGVSVAVIAAILWTQIRDTAETEPSLPVAP